MYHFQKTASFLLSALLLTGCGAEPAVPAETTAQTVSSAGTAAASALITSDFTGISTADSSSELTAQTVESSTISTQTQTQTTSAETALSENTAAENPSSIAERTSAFTTAAATVPAVNSSAGTSSAVSSVYTTETETVPTTSAQNAVPVQTERANLPDSAFTAIGDYQTWAKEIGYPQGYLEAKGGNGINQDHFHTPETATEYTSGKIVIGDSRCCQLGIYAQRANLHDFAVFAVWGGHYVSGTSAPILSEAAVSEIEACFRAQIASVGACEVYFFATVNDYDYKADNNAQNIKAAVSAAEQIASMRYTYQGQEYSPRVTVIGFAGGWTDADIFGIPQETFNRYIDSYNSSLRFAVGAMPFTTVQEITEDKTGFITDGLHYDDGTLGAIRKAITQGI